MNQCSCVEIAIQSQTFRGQPFTILEEKEVHSCMTHFVVECDKCKQKWKVSEDFSYHYPLLFWGREQSEKSTQALN